MASCTAAHHSFCCLHTWVCQAVEGGEHLVAVGHRYERPGVGSAGVADQLHISKLHMLQGSCVAAGCGDVCVWAGPLGLNDGGIVHLGWAGCNGIDLPWWQSGEGVCHNVVHTANVPDVPDVYSAWVSMAQLPLRGHGSAACGLCRG